MAFGRLGTFGTGFGRLGHAPSASPYTAEARTVFAAFTTPPTTARKVLIDALVRALKEGGVWAKLDVLYVLAAADAQAALINWVSPGTRNLTATNSPTFEADRGYTGDGATNFLTPGVALTSFSKFTLNSAHVGVWGRTNVAEDRTITGPNGLTAVRIAPRTSAGSLDGQINDVVTLSAAAIGTSVGHSLVNRSGASARQLYKDGVSVASDTQAASAVPGNALRILAGNSTFSTVQCSMQHVGESLSALEAAAASAAALAYMQGVGAA